MWLFVPSLALELVPLRIRLGDAQWTTAFRSFSIIMAPAAPCTHGWCASPKPAFDPALNVHDVLCVLRWCTALWPRACRESTRTGGFHGSALKKVLQLQYHHFLAGPQPL